MNDDYKDAIALIDLADNLDAINAVLAALSIAFKPSEKRKLWALLTSAQQTKLSKGTNHGQT